MSGINLNKEQNCPREGSRTSLTAETADNRCHSRPVSGDNGGRSWNGHSRDRSSASASGRSSRNTCQAGISQRPTASQNTNSRRKQERKEEIQTETENVAAFQLPHGLFSFIFLGIGLTLLASWIMFDMFGLRWWYWIIVAILGGIGTLFYLMAALDHEGQRPLSPMAYETYIMKCCISGSLTIAVVSPVMYLFIRIFFFIVPYLYRFMKWIGLGAFWAVVGTIVVIVVGAMFLGALSDRSREGRTSGGNMPSYDGGWADEPCRTRPRRTPSNASRTSGKSQPLGRRLR